MKEEAAYRISQVFHPALIEVPAAILAMHIYGISGREITYFAVLPVTGVTGAIYGILELPEFRDLNMDDRDDRQKIYPFAIALLGISAASILLLQSPSIFRRLYLATVVIAAINYLVNRKIKISLHTTGMGVITGIFTFISLELGALFFLASVLVGWSRIVLNRHTLLEASLGFLVSYSLILTAVTV